MAVNATLCRWSCRSTCQLQRRVSGLRGPVLEMELHRLCAYMFGRFHFQIAQWAYLSQSHPAFCAVLQDSQTLYVLYSLCSFIQTWDENCNDFILLRSESSLCFAASHRTPSLAHMFICTPSIPPFVMSCFIPASITQLSLFLGHRLQIDYLSGVQCNDRRPS